MNIQTKLMVFGITLAASASGMETPPKGIDPILNFADAWNDPQVTRKTVDKAFSKLAEKLYDDKLPIDEKAGLVYNELWSSRNCPIYWKDIVKPLQAYLETSKQTTIRGAIQIESEEVPSSDPDSFVEIGKPTRQTTLVDGDDPRAPENQSKRPIVDPVEPVQPVEPRLEKVQGPVAADEESSQPTQGATRPTPFVKLLKLLLLKAPLGTRKFHTGESEAETKDLNVDLKAFASALGIVEDKVQTLESLHRLTNPKLTANGVGDVAFDFYFELTEKYPELETSVEIERVEELIKDMFRQLHLPLWDAWIGSLAQGIKGCSEWFEGQWFQDGPIEVSA